MTCALLIIDVKLIVDILNAPDDGFPFPDDRDGEEEDSLLQQPSTQTMVSQPAEENAAQKKSSKKRKSTTTTTTDGDELVTLKRSKLSELVKKAAESGPGYNTHEDGPSGSTAVYREPPSPTFSEIAEVYQGADVNDNLLNDDKDDGIVFFAG